ncbi:hypothetical protein HK102_012609 [Quaeritorhiza haematococci]|nr:hypothetical protein HK102_012609 [Quaeritorhiza haematococci]
MELLRQMSTSADSLTGSSGSKTTAEGHLPALKGDTASHGSGLPKNVLASSSLGALDTVTGVRMRMETPSSSGPPTLNRPSVSKQSEERKSLVRTGSGSKMESTPPPASPSTAKRVSMMRGASTAETKSSITGGVEGGKYSQMQMGTADTSARTGASIHVERISMNDTPLGSNNSIYSDVDDAAIESHVTWGDMSENGWHDEERSSRNSVQRSRPVSVVIESDPSDSAGRPKSVATQVKDDLSARPHLLRIESDSEKKNGVDQQIAKRRDGSQEEPRKKEIIRVASEFENAEVLGGACTIWSGTPRALDILKELSAKFLHQGTELIALLEVAGSGSSSSSHASTADTTTSLEPTMEGKPLTSSPSAVSLASKQDGITLTFGAVINSVRRIVDVASAIIPVTQLRKCVQELSKLEREIRSDVEISSFAEACKVDASRVRSMIDTTARQIANLIQEYLDAERKLLAKPAEGYRIEATGEPQRDSSSDSNRNIYGDTKLEHIDGDMDCYRKCFMNHEHRTYIGIMDKLGPVIVSLLHEVKRPTKDGGSQDMVAEESQYRAILRMREPSKLVRITDKAIEPRLAQIDELQLVLKYKVGVLYCKEGQKTEEEMFSNENGSDSFNQFLKILGDTVPLKGFTGFAAGLDTKNNQTGAQALNTKWRNFEVTYHVSTYLPYSKDDTQQIQRKRHIGNDIVCVVYLDGNAQFDPTTIKSQFLHIYIIVQEDRSLPDTIGYRVSVVSSQDVPPFGPAIPCPPVFYNAAQFREFIMAKIINGENAAYKAPKFRRPHLRTRGAMIDNIIQDFGRSTMRDSLAENSKRHSGVIISNSNPVGMSGNGSNAGSSSGAGSGSGSLTLAISFNSPITSMVSSTLGLPGSPKSPSFPGSRRPSLFTRRPSMKPPPEPVAPPQNNAGANSNNSSNRNSLNAVYSEETAAGKDGGEHGGGGGSNGGMMTVAEIGASTETLNRSSSEESVSNGEDVSDGCSKSQNSMKMALTRLKRGKRTSSCRSAKSSSETEGKKKAKSTEKLCDDKKPTSPTENHAKMSRKGGFFSLGGSGNGGGSENNNNTDKSSKRQSTGVPLSSKAAEKWDDLFASESDLLDVHKPPQERNADGSGAAL